ncbi:MAG: hypothetical protein JST33_08470 [Actinobacteria bacterium]|nr:hypothetical protein [Actinomycetota bacterium]
MSSDVEITHGGIVAVDPEDLRAMAGRVLHDAAAVQVAREELLEIPALVEQAALAPQVAVGGVGPVWIAVNRLDRAGPALDELASSAGTMADIFEIAELRAQRAMSGVTDPELVKASLHRIGEILAANPRLKQTARSVFEKWQEGAFEGFAPAPGTSPSVAQETPLEMLSWLSPALSLMLLRFGADARTLGSWGEVVLRTIAPGLGQTPRTPLTPTPGRVIVDGALPPGVPGRGAVEPRPGDLLLSTARTPSTVAGGAGASGSAHPVPKAPSSMGDAVARIPYGEAPQVRVEKYTLADGSNRFLAYVDGTRPGEADTEPWDMGSNLDAYVNREESDSYKATVAALRAAGADATTPVDLVGYSQGGMNVGLIAQSGEFGVQGVYTVGSPIEPSLPPDVFDVAVRHTDDPVAGLTGGGRADGLGSPDSMVITRTVAPGHGIDPGLPAHQLAEYRETVRQAEQSGDPRMDAVRDHFAVYDGAALVDSTDYTATRVLDER